MPITGFSQVESTAYTATGRGGVATTFTTDYQTIGINPANLGIRQSFRDPRIIIGIGEMHTTFFAEALDRRELNDAIFNSAGTRFSMAEKHQAATKIANTSVALNMDVMLAGASLQLEDGRGVAISIRDRFQLFARINQTTAELAFLGANASYFPELLLSDGRVIANPTYPGNQSLEPLPEETRQMVINGLYANEDSARLYSEIMDGSRVSSSWYREYNLSYGQQLYESYNLQLYGGVGLRYINGIMMIEMAAENGELVSSNISVSSDFGLSFGDTSQITNPTFIPSRNVSAFRRLAFPRPVGRGYGIDFGITAIIKKNLRLGLAITNIGQLRWRGNVYQVNDGKLVQFAGNGLNNYNLLASEEGAFQFAGDKSPLRWEGANQITEPLPSLIRAGISYEFYKRLHAGIDLIAPRNRVAGNLESWLYAIGADFTPSKIFTLSSGVNFGGNNSSRVNWPAGISYNARKGHYQCGISTRDLLTFFSDIGEGSTVSLAAGFFRIKI